MRKIAKNTKIIKISVAAMIEPAVKGMSFLMYFFSLIRHHLYHTDS